MLTGGAPVGVTVSADPFTKDGPAMVGLTFASDAGVFSQSETYYFSLNKFKELLDKGRGYLLVQGEVVKVGGGRMRRNTP